jgi:uncharacterized membrane protein
MQNVVSRLIRRIGSCFLAGLLAILPVVLTVGVVVWVASFVEGYLGPGTLFGRALTSVGLKVGGDKIVAYAVGWVFVLATIFILGVVVQLGAQRFFQRLLDAVLLRIPLIGSIYGTSKQVVDMFDRKKGAELQGMSVVFCSLGVAGGPGVLALMPSPQQFHIDGRPYHVVIIPTAPVPFGGGLLFMPVELVRPSTISVDGLMSIYVSMGVTTGQFLTEQKT